MGQLIIVTGSTSSGTGKTVVVTSALARLSNAERVVTCTTRKPRPGERDGIDYHFLTDGQFQSHLDNGDFVEYDLHYKHWYGTRSADIERALSKSDLAILVTDLNGANSLRMIFPKACYIAIAATPEDIARFMSDRGDTTEQIALRMKEIAREQAVFYDIPFEFVIWNRPGLLYETIDEFIRSLQSR